MIWLFKVNCKQVFFYFTSEDFSLRRIGANQKMFFQSFVSTYSENKNQTKNRNKTEFETDKFGSDGTWKNFYNVGIKRIVFGEFLTQNFLQSNWLRHQWLMLWTNGLGLGIVKFTNKTWGVANYDARVVTYDNDRLKITLQHLKLRL